VALEYFVDNAEHPRLLARVAGLRISDGIGPNQPTWTRIPSLADMAFNSPGVEVSVERAAEIAAGWGATL
jgi:hypothetical protein